MKPTTFLRVLVCGAFLLLGATGTVLAQPSLDRLQEELQRTDEVMQQAEEIVRQALGPQPSAILREARTMQAQAWQDFRGERWAQSAQRTAKARQMAVRAAELARAQIRLLERVRQLLAENRELVSRAREAVQASTNPEAARLLDAGLKELDRGQRAFNAHQFRQAVRFSLFGRDLLLRAIRAGEGVTTLSANRVREDVARTEEFLAEARTVSGRDGRATQKVQEAERLQDEAKRRLRGRQFEQARRLTMRAREAALDVLRSGVDQPDRDDVQAFIDRVTQRFQEFRAEAGQTDDRQVQRFIQQIEAHLDRARRALGDGDLQHALAEAQLASSLLGQAEQRQR